MVEKESEYKKIPRKNSGDFWVGTDLEIGKDYCILRMMASAISLVPTAVGSLRFSFMS